MSKGLGLKLGSVPKVENEKQELDAKDTKDVKLTFALPDGKTLSHQVQMGFTVEQLKAWVASQTDLPYEKLSLIYKDKPMPDPLTLNDIPVNPSEECKITVKSQ
eukprot:TRINITY_DN17364_c0_g1_i1.p1 TRINITY_DN17364_c0_g1~~TRINITY_DN17364_c0_g1_i1.p1  ORF type:complete len:104 (+),score=11.14 TRINITY_DN17364_c0_g1_i1:3-314(+)